MCTDRESTTHCLQRCFRKTLKEWINECHESENQTTSTPLRITKLPKRSRAWFVVFITFQYMMEISPSSPKSSIPVTLPAEDINHVFINLQRNFPQSSIVYKLLLLLFKQRRHLVLPVSSHLKLRCVGKKTDIRPAPMKTTLTNQEIRSFHGSNLTILQNIWSTILNLRGENCILSFSHSSRCYQVFLCP